MYNKPKVEMEGGSRLKNRISRRQKILPKEVHKNMYINRCFVDASE